MAAGKERARERAVAQLAPGFSDMVFLEHPGKSGSIPVIAVRGKGLAETWELSLLALYAYGCDVRTEYDRKDGSGNFADPPGLDCTMRMVVDDPFSEPVIHRSFPGGLDALEEYRQEVIFGIKDHWCRDPGDPDDERWEYTYHQRMRDFRVPGLEKSFDQIEAVIQGLSKNPHSRRQQAVIWKVWEDVGIHDPACMQSLWFRMLPDEGGALCLNMNVRFRSRDAYEAAFMNCFALIHLMAEVAGGVSERTGQKVRLARYVDESDSYHLYGRKIEDFETRFLRQVETRSFEDRTWTLEFAEPIFEEARPRIKDKIKRHDECS